MDSKEADQVACPPGEEWVGRLTVGCCDCLDLQYMEPAHLRGLADMVEKVGSRVKMEIRCEDCAKDKETLNEPQ